MTGGWGGDKVTDIGPHETLVARPRKLFRCRESIVTILRKMSQYRERSPSYDFLHKPLFCQKSSTFFCCIIALRAFQKGSLRFARFRLPPPNPIFKNMLAEGLNGRWWVISPKHIPCQPHPLLSGQPICGVGFCHAFHPSCFHLSYSLSAPEREKSISACPPLY